MIWNDEYETLPREAMEALQLKRLRALVDRVCSTVPVYKRKLGEMGYKPGDLRTLDDLSRLPFTTKDDLRDNYPFGLFAVPMERVVRIHASSGTTGKPTVVGYTRRDVDTWAEFDLDKIEQPEGWSGAEIGADDDDDDEEPALKPLDGLLPWPGKSRRR